MTKKNLKNQKELREIVLQTETEDQTGKNKQKQSRENQDISQKLEQASRQQEKQQGIKLQVHSSWSDIRLIRAFQKEKTQRGCYQNKNTGLSPETVKEPSLGLKGPAQGYRYTQDAQ